jgi:membrane associated rhomboid family serine protease
MIPLGDSTRLRKPSVVTPMLILINVLVYLYIVMSGSTFSHFALMWGLIPGKVQIAFHLLPLFSPSLKTLFTSLFLHGGFWHLTSNMLFLWVFGDNIEDQLGKIPFLFFYLLGGIIASFAQFFQNPGSMVPMIGASGAISAVMGAYIYLFPGASVETLIPIFLIPFMINIPAVFFLLFWFANQLISASFGTPGVGWMAHIGGFLFGILFAILFIPKEKKPSAREIYYPS